MTASILLLLVVSGFWLMQRSNGDRADLVGAVAAETTTSAPSTTTTIPSAPPTSTTLPAVPAVPTRLSIPAIGIESQVIPVGLEPDGQMEVPPATQAGWYLHGPRPGEVDGTAVVAAHVDYGGERGVFFDLRSVQVGDEVTVTDEAGGAHRYVVAERYQVDKDQLPIEQIFVADGPSALTLITCGGSFDRGARSYQDNIVVRAVPA